MKLLVMGAQILLGLIAAAATMTAQGNTVLLKPAGLAEKAPETFRASFETSAGTFVIEVHRAWAPVGADRFFNLVKNGFYDNVRVFRVIPGFIAQFGINGDPGIAAAWRLARIPDDPTIESNKRGYVSLVKSGPNTRSTQAFINLKDNVFLDGQGYAPFGQVTIGMDVVDKLYAAYGEGSPTGAGPHQQRIQNEGNAYLMKDFPYLDFVRRATIVK